MATTFMDKQANALIKKLHTLTGKAGMNDEAYRAFLYDNYKVNSSKELNAYELLEACNALDKMSNPKAAEIDQQRKRVIASIGGYLRTIGAGGNDIEKIKRIACRASECEYFNQIPMEKLRSVYYTFKNKQKVAAKADEVVSEVLAELKSLN